MTTTDSLRQFLRQSALARVGFAAAALLLIAVGGIFLLSNLHLLRVHDIWEYWPVILMVLGVFKLVDAEDGSRRTVLSGGAREAETI